jgi:hypothetical protein
MSELWASCDVCDDTFAVPAADRRPYPPACPQCLTPATRTALAASAELARTLLARR